MAEWVGEMRRADEVRVYEDVRDLRNYLEDDTEDPREEVLMVLAHHADNRLFFDSLAEVPNVTSSTIQRRYDVPSLVIINACGAASPAADGFLREFNEKGVSSIVATITAVDARMAGSFMALLGDLFNDGAQASYGIGAAVFETVRALAVAPDGHGDMYGPRALIYSVVGNANVRICSRAP